MRQRFKARELWLFAPFLLIIVAALFYWRWEQINPPDKRGMYVSKVEVSRATPRLESDGISHYVTVTLSHSWPKPRWWGKQWPEEYRLDPFDPQISTPFRPSSQAVAVIGFGAALNTENAGQVQLNRWFKNKVSVSIDFDGNNYIATHSVNLRSVPQSAGEVTFNGIYQMTGTPKRMVTRVLRASGETLRPVDKESGARLVSVRATSWKKEEQTNPDNVVFKDDTIFIKVVLENIVPSTKRAKNHELHGAITDVSDEPRSNFNYSTDFMGTESKPELTMQPNQDGEVLYLSLSEQDKTQGRITVEGKISLDEHWPLFFKVKLPPRPATASPAKQTKAKIPPPSF